MAMGMLQIRPYTRCDADDDRLPALPAQPGTSRVVGREAMCRCPGNNRSMYDVIKCRCDVAVVVLTMTNNYKFHGNRQGGNDNVLIACDNNTDDGDSL